MENRYLESLCLPFPLPFSTPSDTCRRREGNGVYSRRFVGRERNDSAPFEKKRTGGKIRDESKVNGEKMMGEGRASCGNGIGREGSDIYIEFSVWRIINANDTDIESAYNHAAGLIG